jgi:hypothetical protein
MEDFRKALFQEEVLGPKKNLPPWSDFEEYTYFAIQHNPSGERLWVETCTKEAGPLLTLPLNSIPIYRTSLGRQGVVNLYFA